MRTLGIAIIAVAIKALLSADCGVRNFDCRVKNGLEYVGNVSTTKSGLECQAWNVRTPHNHTYGRLGSHNYCRNPDDGLYGLWCFTTSSTRWEACSVRECTDCDKVDDCGETDFVCRVGDGVDYVGNVSKTKSGLECQAWNVRIPHNHTYGKMLGNDRNYCRNPYGGSHGPWCFTTSSKRWESCSVRECTDCDKVPDSVKQEYLALQIDGTDEYFKQVKKRLPKLLWADLLDKEEVGVALARQSVYPALEFRRGEDLVDLYPKNKVVSINGTVTKKIGKRTYDGAKFRQTGLYAAPGEIVTITIPPQLIGKISAFIGQDEKVQIKFETLHKAVNKIASPYGGLILVYLSDIDATTKEGIFEVTIDNAVQAPFFSLGINTNEEWSEMKKYSPPFTVLRIPGQISIYMQTKHLQTVTDMVAFLKNWKVTMDLLDNLMGVPVNVQPGEERLHWNPTVGLSWAGIRVGICQGGARSEALDGYAEEFVDYKNRHPKVVFHELGHGYCYSDLPDMGGQWTAEFIREYIERKRNYDVGAKHFEFPFSILHQMVSFSKLSKGKACGIAKFPAGDDLSKTSFPYNAYFTCWTTLYRLPLWEFGWDVLRILFTLDTKSTTTYSSKNDRMADLYCQATKSNLIPMFEFYNINISKSVADSCRKQKAPVMITNYIKIANCIMNKDIMECASLPEFPPYTGICRLSGVCNKHPDYDGKQIKLNEEFDLWGGTTSDEHKKGMIDTTRNEQNCHGRAKETFKWCKNEKDQSITASFTLKDGVSSSRSFPPPGNCYYDHPRQLPHYAGDSKEMIPEKCNEMCDKKSYQYFGVQNYRECWCGDAMPSIYRLQPEECDRPCSGDSTKACGGGYKNNIWKVCMGFRCEFNYD